MKKMLLNINSILILSFIARLIFFFYFADINLDNEWGKLVHNLYHTGTLGINVAKDNFAEHAFAELGDKVLPSVFMPPLYAYFIFLLKTIFSDKYNIVNIVIFAQIVLSLFSILIFFKISNNFFQKKISFFATLVFAILPINLYSVVQISSITLQVLLLMLYLLTLLKIINNGIASHIISFSVFAGLLILTRGEFLFFYIITLIYLFYYNKTNIYKCLICLIVVFITLSPYLIRNYITFNSLVLTKSLGYNLLKGNNPESRVEGNVFFIDKNFNQKNLSINVDNRYEINLDNFYKQKAFEFIKKDSLKYLKLFLLKIGSFLFFDFNSTYPNYYNLAHIVPKIFLSIFSFISAIICFQKESFFKFLSIFYFCNIFLFSIFFILPRYSLTLIPIQLLLISYLIFHLINKFKKNF